MPMNMARKPRERVVLAVEEETVTRWPRRRTWSTSTTPSHGPIQYEMISRKSSYFCPASCSPDQRQEEAGDAEDERRQWPGAATAAA